MCGFAVKNDADWPGLWQDWVLRHDLFMNASFENHTYARPLVFCCIESRCERCVREEWACGRAGHCRRTAGAVCLVRVRARERAKEIFRKNSIS